MDLAELNYLGGNVALIVRDRLKFKVLTFHAQQCLDDQDYSGGMMSRDGYEKQFYALSIEQIQNLLKLDEASARQRLGLMLIGIARRLFGGLL